MNSLALHLPHKHVEKGAGSMETPKKVYKFGNTIGIIHSPLVNMSSEERREFYRQEMAKKNPVLMQIAHAALECRKRSRGDEENESITKGVQLRRK